jgi:RNA-directed DNA polymerase
MVLLRRLYAKLRLKVNETKSAVSSVFARRKFLGYDFWKSGSQIKCAVADKPMAAFKQRIRQLTRRSGGRSMQQVVDRLRAYLLGWKAYFRLAQTPRLWRDLDRWIRHRLRAIQLYHWRAPFTIYGALRALGARSEVAGSVAYHAPRWWHTSGGILRTVLTTEYFDRLGVPRLSLNL